MRKHLLLLTLALLAFAWPTAALADATNISNKPGLPPELNNFLRNADTFILFSLGSNPDADDKSTNTFMGHIVLGQTTITRPQTRSCLIETLNKFIFTPPQPYLHDTSSPVAAPDYFWSRHGIRVTKGDEAIELLLDLGSNGMHEMLVRSNKGQSSFSLITPLSQTDDNPAATFNWILKRNHVPLPKD